jgi:hypothetical protein
MCAITATSPPRIIALNVSAACSIPNPKSAATQNAKNINPLPLRFRQMLKHLIVSLVLALSLAAPAMAASDPLLASIAASLPDPSTAPPAATFESINDTDYQSPSDALVNLTAIEALIPSVVISTDQYAGPYINANHQRQLVAQVWFARMRAEVRAHQRNLAQLAGIAAIAAGREYDDRGQYAAQIAQQESPYYWDMLSSAMQRVLEDHGGMRSDNSDARPTEWKTDNDSPGIDVWVYRDGSGTKAYRFVNGALAH